MDSKEGEKVCQVRKKQVEGGGSGQKETKSEVVRSGKSTAQQLKSRRRAKREGGSPSRGMNRSSGARTGTSVNPCSSRSKSRWRLSSEGQRHWLAACRVRTDLLLREEQGQQ